MKLKKKIFIRGKVIAKTGLMIGGAGTALGIGGPDKMVIRNPINNEPYIPGSSLKGKMRALTELCYGYVKDVDMSNVKNGPSDNPEHITALLYGSTHKETSKQRPSRIIVRDGKLLNGESFGDKTDLPFTEAKTEVIIDRITSAAMPRTFERVPAGAEFLLDIVVNIFDHDDKEQELFNHTIKGLMLVQDDYLGGSGSRGSGQVQFIIESITERDSDFYQSEKMEVNSQNLLSNYSIPKELLNAPRISNTEIEVSESTASL